MARKGLLSTEITSNTLLLSGVGLYHSWERDNDRKHRRNKDWFLLRVGGRFHEVSGN